MEPTLRRTVVLPVAATGGLISAALLWRAPLGVSWPLAVSLFIATCLVAFRPPTRLALAWGAGAVWSSGTLAWYQSQWALQLAFPLSLALCVTFPLMLHRRLTLGSLGDLCALFVAQATAVPESVAETGRLLRSSRGPGRPRIFGGIAIGFPVAFIAASMLRTNPHFDRAVGRLLHGGSDIVSFLWWAACAATVLGAGILSLNRLHCGLLERLRSGALLGHTRVARSAPAADSPYRADSGRGVIVEHIPRTLSPATWSVVLGQLVAVFGLFVAVNLPVLFGGHGLVRAPDTVTYAAHLHSGFYAVTGATLLSTVVVMFGHRAVAGGAGVRLITGLELTLLGLTAVTLASCWHRLSAYMDAYGTTHLRVGVLAVQVVVLGLILATVARTIHRSWRGHMAAVVLIPVVVGLAATTFNTDLYIARANLARLVDAPDTATSTGLDRNYMRSLSVDALPALDAPHIPPDLAVELRATWELEHRYASPNDWRGVRGLGSMLP